jgi:hypothetical protein
MLRPNSRPDHQIPIKRNGTPWLISTKLPCVAPLKTTPIPAMPERVLSNVRAWPRISCQFMPKNPSEMSERPHVIHRMTLFQLSVPHSGLAK